MKKYILNYHAPAEAMAKMANATPNEKAEVMKPWMAWKDKIGDSLVDMGAPMVGVYRVNSQATEANNGSEVTGYSIIQAESLEEAQTLLENHPHLEWGDNCVIEVFECA